MNREIEMYKKKLKTIETALRELKYYRKALERDICKFFIKSYDNEDLDCNMCLVPGGHKDVKDSNYQHYIYRNSETMTKVFVDSVRGKSDASDAVVRDLIRFRSLKKSIKEVDRSIKDNIKLYNELMKEYKEFKNELSSR